jgi:DHA1 family multidrug resistance protein-like MFS transporter
LNKKIYKNIRVNHLEEWHKDLLILWLIMSITMTAFGSVFPFLPLYLLKLEVMDPEQASLWGGIITGTASSLMVVSAPIWGILGGEIGRKRTILIGLFGFAGVLLSASLAPNIYFLAPTWILLGVLPGPGMITLAFVSDIVPKERLTYAVGLLTSANFIGFAIGPLVGGKFVDQLGFRTVLIAAGALLILSGLIVLIKIVSVVTVSNRSGINNPLRIYQDALKLVKTHHFNTTIPVLFIVQLVGCLLMPVIPIFIREIARVQEAGWLAGLAFGIMGITGGIASICTTQIQRVMSPKTSIYLCFVCMAIMYTIIVSSDSLIVIYINLGFVGICNGIMGTLAFSLIGQSSHVDSGKAYGLSHSISAVAWGAGPIIGGLSANYLGLRDVFVINVVFCLIGVVIALRLSNSLGVYRDHPSTSKQLG